MWHKASDIAGQAISRSGASRQVEAENIITTTNKLGQNQYQATCFRQGILTIKPIDSDPIILQADSLKIRNQLNKILKKKVIEKVRITNY